MDITIPDAIVFRLHGKRVKGGFGYDEFFLCFRHAVEAVMQGQDVDVKLEEETCFGMYSCDCCKGKEPEDIGRK